MALSDFATGTIMALICSIAFGTQTSFAKIPSVISSGVRMEILSTYFLMGVAVISLLGYAVMALFFQETITFSVNGIYCSILLYLGQLFMFLGVQSIGVTYGMCLSVLSSAVLSIIIQIALGQSFWSYGVSVAGLAVVACSVIGCAMLKRILAYFNVMDYARIEKSVQLDKLRRESVFNILAETSPLVIDGEAAAAGHSVQSSNVSIRSDGLQVVSKQMMMGFLWSSLGGVCFCMVPLPSLFVEETAAGIRFSLSFGIGCLVVLPLAMLKVILLNVFHKEDGTSTKQIAYDLVTFSNNLWHFKEACLPGLFSGIVWGIGNLLGICSFQYLNFVIVMVYVQFHIPVALLWGICLWKEITQPVEIISLIGLIVCLIGGMVLTTYGVYGSIF